MRSLSRYTTLLNLVFFTAIVTAFAQDAFAQEEGYSEVNGVKTFYRVFGSKSPPLLIINGGPGMSSEGFVGLAQMLASENRTIIYDQRGTGKSRLSVLDTSTITMRLMVEDIEALRKHLGYKAWNVLGHSFGGLLAAYYATLYPQSIEKVVLSSSGGVNLDFVRTVGQRIQANLTQTERDSLAFWEKRVNGGDTSSHARLRRATALAPAYLFDKQHVSTIAERLTQGNMRLNGLVFQNLQAMKFDCTKELRSFRQPTLVMHGKNDIIGVDIAEQTRQAFPNSRLVLLDSCAHYGWLDRKNEYLSAVQGFLKGAK